MPRRWRTIRSLPVPGGSDRFHRRLAGARQRAGQALALGAAAAMVAAVAAPSAVTATAQPRVSVAITSVSPRIAKPGSTVTVSGIVSNPTTKPMAGLSVQLWSSGTSLASRESLASYLSASEVTSADAQVPGAVHAFTGPLPAHATRQWSLELRASQFGLRSFGVYPLAAQLNGPDGAIGVARGLLPFWPGKTGARSLKPLAAAWVWPLIDDPQQAACRALRTGELAASVSGNGRLNTLLEAGLTPAGRRADLTWAIDPALISDVSLMSGPYRVGADDTCAGGKPTPASVAARAWLAGAHSVVSQQNFFTTPYADVDVAALAHRGLDAELRSAFGVGRTTARSLLGATQSTPPVTGPFAWPASGMADYGVLEGLAVNRVRTVILDSSVMPPTDGTLTYTPGAVTSTLDGQGSRLHVLLADRALTKILATPGTRIPGVVPAPPPAGSPGLAQAAAFSKEQLFLAETAMIASENPSLARSVVIAPPRRWDPRHGVAQALLRETVSAPWLRPASLADLITTRPLAGAVPRQRPPSHRVSKGELKAPLLRQVRSLTGQIHLLASILTTGGRGYLSTAVAAIESSAWRGSRTGARHAKQALRSVSRYVRGQFGQIKIIDPQHVTLGGKSGAVPVSISNHLHGRDIRVQLTVTVPSASTAQVQIGSYQHTVTVEAGTQRTIKIPVRTTKAGSTTLTLRLATPGGKPLPGESATLTVQATHFGMLAIVIIAVALVVFLLTAVSRAFRREEAEGGQAAEAAGEEGEIPQTARGSASDGTQADSVVPQAADSTDAVREADDHASTPGQAQRR